MAKATQPQSTPSSPIYDESFPIAQRLNSVANMITRSALRVYPSATGLKTVEARTLHGVGLFGPGSARDIARMIDLNEAQASVAIKQLKKKRLLESIRDPSDGRRKHLMLTAPGKTLFKKVDDILRSRHHSILSGLSTTEAQDFFVLLDRVSVGAQRLLDGERPKNSRRK